MHREGHVNFPNTCLRIPEQPKDKHCHIHITEAWDTPSVPNISYNPVNVSAEFTPG